jgi:hypothetical protein
VTVRRSAFDKSTVWNGVTTPIAMPGRPMTGWNRLRTHREAAPADCCPQPDRRIQSGVAVRRAAGLARFAWRSCRQLRQKILLFAIKIGNDLLNGVIQA